MSKDCIHSRSSSTTTSIEDQKKKKKKKKIERNAKKRVVRIQEYKSSSWKKISSCGTNFSSL
jgi:hypothetical protein